MKALLLALALAFVAQAAPPVRPVAPLPPATKPDAPPPKTAPAKPPAPPPVPPNQAEDALAECRANCGQSRLFCLQQEDSDTCDPAWLQCRAKCTRANPT